MGTVAVHLGGRLGTLFGRMWSLNVNSVAEAIHAININTKGALHQYLAKDNGQRKYVVSLQKKDNSIGEEELKNRIGHSDIYIYPSVRGRSDGFKIILGAALILVGLFVPGLGLYGVALIGFGASLVLGGITQWLTPTPKQYQQNQSYDFQGNATTVNQGGCVPVVYGRYLVAPLPISIAFNGQAGNSVSVSGGGGNNAALGSPQSQGVATTVTNSNPGSLGVSQSVNSNDTYTNVVGIPPWVQNATDG